MTVTADHVLEVAQQLSPEAVETCEPISGGGNNRLYKIKSKQNYYALKWYPTLPNDTRDRLGTEFQALEFLQDHGPSPTPRAIAASPETGFALYSWTPWSNHLQGRSLRY